jgi:hypothetical protein
MKSLQTNANTSNKSEAPRPALQGNPHEGSDAYQTRIVTLTSPPSWRGKENPGLRPLARPDWLPESAWPFAGFSLEVDGADVAVTDFGHGPVLLFVHTGFWSFIGAT